MATAVSQNGRPVSRLVPYRERPATLFGATRGAIEVPFARLAKESGDAKNKNMVMLGVLSQMVDLMHARAGGHRDAIAGGEAGPLLVAESASAIPERKPVVLREHRLTQILGIAVGTEEIETWLYRLGMQAGLEFNFIQGLKVGGIGNRHI